MATRRRNVAMGMTIGSGPGRVFHPFRSSSDYDPVLAGEKKKRKPAARKKATAKKATAKKKATVKKAATKRKTTTKRVAIKKRATAPRKKTPSTVFVGGKFKTVTALKAYAKKHGIAHGEIIRAGDGTKANTYYYLKVAKTKNPRRGNPPHTITLPVARHMGSLYAQQGLTKQSAWEKFLAWARTRTTAVSLPADSIKRQRVKEAFLKEYDRVKGMKNPRSRNPQLQMVGKSKYKATMDKAKALMPFPGAKVEKGWTGDYFLLVNKQNVAMARSILNAMAKTMTKKVAK